jgi:hypothetical protein
MIPGMNDNNCFLCRQPARKQPESLNFTVECRRCGSYRITTPCSLSLRGADEKTLTALSAATRQASDGGALLLLKTDNWAQVAAAHTNTPVRQKAIKLLRYIATKSKYPGDLVLLEAPFDYATCDAATPSEFYFLITHLQEGGYLLGQGGPALTVSVKGWNEIEPPAGTVGIPGRCFVAMSFAEELDGAYLFGIKPAVEHDCQMQAIRMKELHHNHDICDRLLSEILQAQFVVADYSDPRYGVYYEAGFARALGREVINCCRESDFGKLHFDTNHLNHIKWTTPADLRQKLTDRIRATILKP